MRPPTFRGATDALCLTAEQVVAEFKKAGREVSLASVNQARMKNARAKGYRPPPEGWERVLLGVARKRRKGMQELVEALARAVEGRG